MRLVLLLAILALPGHLLEVPHVLQAPHVVFVIGESEYDTATTLPDFAAAELETRGVRSTFVLADENDFSGIEALESADIVVLSVRRRTPPQDQLAVIRSYLKRGKPLVALRTSSHAFALRSGAPPEGHKHERLKSGSSRTSVCRQASDSHHGKRVTRHSFRSSSGIASRAFRPIGRSAHTHRSSPRPDANVTLALCY
jgi:hypothetical protein